MQSVRIAIVVSVAAGLLGASACRGGDCELTATCIGSASPSSDGSTDPNGDSGSAEAETDGGRVYPPVEPPEGCDPAADPQSAPKCINDKYALFVDSESGDDRNPGTQEKPLQSIAAATNNDTLAGRARIYVTSADQRGSFALPPGVTLIGGSNRVTWQPTVGQTTKISTDVAGPLLRISSSTSRPGEIQVTDVDLTPARGNLLGESSIGIEVISTAVTFRRVAIHAQNGARGPLTPTPNNHREQSGEGQQGVAEHGGASISCACGVQGSTTGGAGGDPSKPGADGRAEPPAVVSGVKTSKGGAAGCQNGADGSDGAAGPGGAASGIVGRMTEKGWEPANGANGAYGGPGAGGGGGGGSAGLGGASGGCGGCGGAGGFGGGAGGSSIGIAAFASDITVTDTTIETKVGGDGEIGGGGQQGQSGAAGNQTGACKGGAGGFGAGGSGGGGGAGGVSVPIVRFGGSVKRVGTVTLTPGAHGKAGGGGELGPAASSSGAPGNTGFGGSALTTKYEELELKQ